MLGLTTSTLSLVRRIEIEQGPVAGTDCLRLLSLDVTFRLEQEVFVDRRYSSGSCEGRAIRSHESEHVRFNRDTFLAMRPQLEDSVERLAERLGGGWLAVEDAKAALEQELRTLSRNSWAELRQRAGPRHESIDGMGSYIRQIRRCSNW